VNTSGVLKTLLDKRLITTAGRKEVIGRPILYKTSKEFLMRFGLSDLEELPSLKEFEALAREALGSDEGVARPKAATKAYSTPRKMLPQPMATPSRKQPTPRPTKLSPNQKQAAKTKQSRATNKHTRPQQPANSVVALMFTLSCEGLVRVSTTRTR